MDHNRSPSYASGARANRRASTQLTIDEEGRKPLFSKPSRESLEPPNPAQTVTASHRFGYSPTNNNTNIHASANPTGRLPSRAAIPRPSSSASQTPSINSNHSVENNSPGSRIPRPKSVGLFAKGTGASVAKAWELADENRVRTLERARRPSPAIDASPSPAPRPYIPRQTHDESKSRRSLGKDAVDYSRPRPLSRLSNDSLRDSYVARYGGSPGSQNSLSSSGSFDRRLTQYEREMEQTPREPDNLFGKAATGPRIAETGHSLARRTSSSSSLNRAPSLGRRVSNNSLGDGQNLGRRTSYGSLGGSPRPPVFAKSHVPEGRIKELLQQDEMGIKRPIKTTSATADTPLPSAEAAVLPQEPTPPTSRPPSANHEPFSPEKSYAWQLDADFTAGDLQISDSPRITMAGTAFGEVANRRNSSSTSPFADGHRSPAAPESNGPFSRDSSIGAATRPGRSNNRIDMIRQREEQADAELAEQRKLQSLARNTRLQEISEREAEIEDQMGKQSRAQLHSHYPTPDDDPPVHEETKTLPQPKNTKLDTIRAREAESLSKKAMASSRLEEIREHNSMSKSLSPESRRSNEHAKNPAPPLEGDREDSKLADEDGEHIPDTPVTIYRNHLASKDSKSHDTSPTDTRKDLGSPKFTRPQTAHRREDSRDLLQKLSRATSSSPAPETQGLTTAIDQAMKHHVVDGEKPKASGEDKIGQRDYASFQSHQRGKSEGEKTKAIGEDKIGRRESVSLRSHQRGKSEGGIQDTAATADLQKEGAEQVAKEPESRRRWNERRSERWRERQTDPPLRERTVVQEPEPTVGLSRLSHKDSKAPEPARDDIISEPQPSPADGSKPSENGERPRSAAGYGGRRRDLGQRSIDTAKDGRKSMASSDSDPTDRIEQEKNLFELTEGLSERGSRAPSAEPSTEDEDKDLLAGETPRPTKVDPMSLPTPKVMGAFVETPATTRAERIEEDFKPLMRPERTSDASQGRPPSRRGSRPSSEAPSFSNMNETGSGSNSGEVQKKESEGTATTSVLRRRNRSTSRPRPPLTNSVKPPTVKDDLLELQRRHQIDDSTLDDFEEKFNLEKLQNTPSPAIEDMLDEISIKREEIAAKPNLTQSERDRELEQYDRMSKALTDGLQNIRTAKQGIERLEGQVAHAEDKQAETKTDTENSKKQETEETSHHRPHPDHALDCPDCVGASLTKEVSYLHLPVPSLYRRKPFRLTFVGLVFLIASLWYAAESAMCEVYCRPSSCSSTPCIWSSTDPTWGVAIPVKLDEWATNGWGRQVAMQFSEDASDFFADAVDFVTGTDITNVDMSTLDFYGRRQHRRRLRKKGLAKKPPVESPEDKAKWDAWHVERVANERVEKAREMGYDIRDFDEVIGGDEVV
ncbi:hypothetical protein CTA2_7308 [Colletotrichum tanaceti]|uniref:Uncharacterized protein n=1 Tax=Colletotrichum tanaceti TaxID=1306861 RepID=A0A4U6XSE9_9PEZI|nr:hypothetical protein CTA2_7308 [Colletotrichum tanaceti]TKW58820.1 hypothetical protein CTA1_8633 [Colletotrichum tanaceti]